MGHEGAAGAHHKAAAAEDTQWDDPSIPALDAAPATAAVAEDTLWDDPSIPELNAPSEPAPTAEALPTTAAGDLAANYDAWNDLSATAPVAAGEKPPVATAPDPTTEGWAAWAEDSKESTDTAPVAQQESTPGVTKPRERVNANTENYRGVSAAQKLTEIMGLSTTALTFRERMSAAGKKTLSDAWESVLGAPEKLAQTAGKSAERFFHRTGAKLEIAYNQFWSDHHEKKAAVLKGKLDLFDMQTMRLTQNRLSLVETIDRLKKQGAPGTAELEFGLKTFDRQLAEIKTKRDPIQGEIDARQRKLSSYVNERDRIADGVIALYNETLGPMERELDFLQECKSREDLIIQGTEARLKVEHAKLDAAERAVAEQEEIQRALGVKPRQLLKIFGPIKDGNIAQRRRLEAEMQPLLRKQAEIAGRIAEVEAAASPYRNKREEYTRIKGDRPIDLASAAETPASATAPKSPSSPEAGSPTIESEETAREAGKLVGGWNDYLKDKYKPKEVPKEEQLDPKAFLAAIANSETDKMEPKDFTALLRRYYEKRAPGPKFDKDYPEFIMKMLENK